jgi:hypothetical protein
MPNSDIRLAGAVGILELSFACWHAAAGELIARR